jgi:hypothetical protein
LTVEKMCWMRDSAQPQTSHSPRASRSRGEFCIYSLYSVPGVGKDNVVSKQAIGDIVRCAAMGTEPSGKTIYIHRWVGHLPILIGGRSMCVVWLVSQVVILYSRLAGQFFSLSRLRNSSIGSYRSAFRLVHNGLISLKHLDESHLYISS